MNTLDFELIRLGLSRQDPEAFAALRRIETVQGELVAALEATRAALDHVVGQIPNDERLANWRLDVAEAADAKAGAVLAKAREGSKGDSA